MGETEVKIQLRAAVVVVVLAALCTAAPAQAKAPADCGPQDRLETGLQGQVPLADRTSGRAAEGYNCNLDEVGFFPSTSFANFDTYENCAYYSDTIGVPRAEGGTIVLDVSDPRKPVQTDYLTARATRNAGESLRVNIRRGLLVADRYVLRGVGKLDEMETTHSLAVYDIKGDCRKPKLLADVIMPTAVGHEACFQPDGMVYYMASTQTITPIDLSDPAHPKQLSEPWPLSIHGCSISEDGKRGYFADIGKTRMVVVDTSEVQARKPGAQYREIGELPTPTNGGQQSTIPLTYGGRPYLFNWAEYVALGQPCIPGVTADSNFGYPLIIDIADETQPKLVSKLQTEAMLPENCADVLPDTAYGTTLGLTTGDPFALIATRAFLYDSHYCSTDRTHDPTIVACTSFASGVRVYDIRDPRSPVEIAYWNPGFVATPDGSAFMGNLSVARPIVRSDLGQIWFPDIAKGFHVLQFRDGVWPFKGQDPCPHEDEYLEQYDLGHRDCRAQRRSPVQLPGNKVCRSRRDFTIRLRKPRSGRITSARVYVDGRRVKVVRGRRLRTRIDLRGLPKGRYTVRVVVRTSTGRTITRTRRYRTCVPGRAVRPRSASVARAVGNARLAAQFLALCRLAR